MKEHISDLRLEQLALGELSEEEQKNLKRRLEEDPEARARMEALRETQVLEKVPPDVFKTEVQRRLRKEDSQKAQDKSPQRWLGWGGLAAMAAILLVVGVPDRKVETASVGIAGERTKGVAPSLVAYRVDGERNEQLENGQQAAEGDRIQLGATGAVGRYAVVVSIDGRGHVTLHHPQGGNSEPIGVTPFSLPSSFELDNAPGYERFILVTAETALDIDTIVKSAQALAESKKSSDGILSGLPPNALQESLLLRKPGG